VHELELIRSSESEKQDQIRHVRAFQSAHSEASELALQELQQIARERGNIFDALMETVKTNSLSQISAALYAVGGEYRRNM
jgi:methylmalonyl-CoA mutase